LSINQTAFSIAMKDMGFMINAAQANMKYLSGPVYNVLGYGAKGDGVKDDTASIQKAIDAAYAAGGGQVFFPTGTYLTSRLYLKSNVRMNGNGATLKASVGSNYIISLVNGSNMIIEDFIFDCTNLTAIGGDDGAGASAVYLPVTQQPFDFIHVVDNKFINIPMNAQEYHALLVNGANIYVSGNYVPQCGGDSLNFNGGLNIVTNNIVKNSNDGAIAFNNGAKGIISNNIIEKCNLGVGAGPEGTNTDPDLYEHQFVISNNEITGCDYGMLFGWFGYVGRNGPTNFIVQGNTIRKCRSAAFQYDGATNTWEANGSIIGNVITGTGSDLYNGTFSTNCHDILVVNSGLVNITGNTCVRSEGTGTRQGIYVSNSDNITVEANNIRGKDSSPYSYGIYVDDCQFSNFNNNNINLATTGILSEDSGRSRGKYNAYCSNSIFQFGDKGIVIIESATNFEISENTIFSGASNAWGIHISPVAQFFSVSNNTIYVPNYAIAINAGPADNYRVEGNTVFSKLIDDAGTGTSKQVTNNW
jgi:hypothetical protein